MAKRKKVAKTQEKVLDIESGKRGRGRPGVRATEIQGRGDHYRIIFGQIWERLREPLLKARTKEEVAKVVEEYGSLCSQEFVPALSSLILKVIREPKFPKKPKAQTGFLADSLAGRGRISPRRSRDICERERSKSKNEHHIIRQDFYIECTCRYKGPALHGRCPKCGTDRLSLPFPGLGDQGFTRLSRT
jgi:hypothetical protein